MTEFSVGTIDATVNTICPMPDDVELHSERPAPVTSPVSYAMPEPLDVVLATDAPEPTNVSAASPPVVDAAVDAPGPK